MKKQYFQPAVRCVVMRQSILSDGMSLHDEVGSGQLSKKSTWSKTDSDASPRSKNLWEDNEEE